MGVYTSNRRKGARSLDAVPRQVLSDLERGLCETANLMEWLRADMPRLARNIARTLDRDTQRRLRRAARQAAGRGVLTRLSVFGKAFVLLEDEGSTWADLARHRSDIVRQWMAYASNLKPGRALEERLRSTLHFAADANMSVRECAWMAFRPHVAADLKKAIELLFPLTSSMDPNIRRFAIEVTRPRSVWGKHIPELKIDPQLARKLLECVRADPSRYVRLAAGNWLNDASKTRPDWVIALCCDWSRAKSKETAHIVARALRTVRSDYRNSIKHPSLFAHPSELVALLEGGQS
jgi:3-methyladenine DNA glycosylase AlkC